MADPAGLPISLVFGGKTTLTQVLTQISEKTDFSEEYISEINIQNSKHYLIPSPLVIRRLVKNPIRSRPLTVHFCVSAFGLQL